MIGRDPYVEAGAVVVSGRVAILYAQVLAWPEVAGALDRHADTEEIETRRAMRKAAKRYAAQVRASQRSNETPDPADAATSWISAGEAARILGVSTRRVQQLASGGLGEKSAGRWRLDRDLVVVLAEERRSE